MKAYRFQTKITKSGTIQIPFTPGIQEMEVEVIILPKEKKITKKLSAKDFIEKWSGFLNSENPDNLKYNYLSEKYK